MLLILLPFIHYTSTGFSELFHLQALYRIPRNTAHCGPTELRFSALVSGRPSSFCSSASLNATGLIFGKFKGHRNVVLRAEENSDEIEIENVENVENEEENEGSVVEEAEEAGEAEAEEEEVETEERPPRKPRIKLGEIMGVNSLCAIGVFFYISENVYKFCLT